MFLFGHPPRVVPFFGYRKEDRLVISARALRDLPPRWDHTGALRKVGTLLRRFASKEQAHLPVTLVTVSPQGLRSQHDAITDDEGFVHFDIAIDDWPLPATTGWEAVELQWINREGGQSVPGFVLAPGRDAGLAVISDIDDTIIETGITGGVRSVARNWKRLLAQMPADRLQVPGADRLYGALSGTAARPGEQSAGDRLPAPHRPFFYISSSPWNLFSYLVTFMKARGLPIGPIALRDWGFNRATLGSAGHGAHKLAALEGLLAFYPDLRFALIGDDTQSDLVAFSRIAEHHEKRIAAIFIREAGETHDAEEIAARERIAAAGVPFWMGKTYEVGDDFLQRLGLDHDGEAERIVDMVENHGQTGADVPGGDAG